MSETKPDRCPCYRRYPSNNHPACGVKGVPCSCCECGSPHEERCTHPWHTTPDPEPCEVCGYTSGHRESCPAYFGNAPTPAPQDEAAERKSVWLIERRHGADNSGWWLGRTNGVDRFSWDINQAVQFRSKTDAESVINAASMGLSIIATEHLFIADRVPPWRQGR